MLDGGLHKVAVEKAYSEDRFCGSLTAVICPTIILCYSTQYCQISLLNV